MFVQGQWKDLAAWSGIGLEVIVLAVKVNVGFTARARNHRFGLLYLFH